MDSTNDMRYQGLPKLLDTRILPLFVITPDGTITVVTFIHLRLWTSAIEEASGFRSLQNSRVAARKKGRAARRNSFLVFRGKCTVSNSICSCLGSAPSRNSCVLQHG